MVSTCSDMIRWTDDEDRSFASCVDYEIGVWAIKTRNCSAV